MKNKLIPKLTLDGSYTFYNPELDENYHSLDGAKSESEYVYIQHGLERLEKQPSALIFEMGFGTGLNALLSYHWAIRNSIQLHYTGIEAFPIDQVSLDFLIQNDPYIKENQEEFKILHSSSDEYSSLNEKFAFRLFRTRMEDYDSRDLEGKVDVVYYDAFAPSRQKDIWEDSNIQKAYKMLKENGILSTYCASGDFKRSLKRAGFELIKEKGFGKKREMFLGIKKP